MVVFLLYSHKGLVLSCLASPLEFKVAPRETRPESERTLALMGAVMRRLFGSPLGDVQIANPFVLRFIEQNKGKCRRCLCGVFSCMNSGPVQSFLEEWSKLEPSEMSRRWPLPPPKGKQFVARVCISPLLKAGLLLPSSSASTSNCMPTREDCALDCPRRCRLAFLSLSLFRMFSRSIKPKALPLLLLLALNDGGDVVRAEVENDLH